jgi:hypothetical protein
MLDAELLITWRKTKKIQNRWNSWSRICFNWRQSFKEDEAEVKSKINQLLTGSVVYNQATGKSLLVLELRECRGICNSNSDVPLRF